MAENRRGPGRPPGSRNKTEKHAAEGKNGTKSKSKSSAPDSRAKAKAQEIQAKKKSDKRVMDEIWSIITIAIGVFLVIATMTDAAGEFGHMIGNALKGLFGFMAYILPFYLIVFGVLLFARKTSHFSVKTFLLLLLILLMLATMNSIHFLDMEDLSVNMKAIKAFYTSGETLLSGGVFGMVLASLLVKWLGVAGCWIFTLVTVTVCLLFLINTPISRFFTKIAEKVEERKLVKEHAHLDLDTEDEQGIQVAMMLAENGSEKKSIDRREEYLKSGGLLQGKTLLAAAAENTERKRELKIVNSSILENDEQIMPGKSPELNERMPDSDFILPHETYIPPSQAAGIMDEPHSTGNNVLKYMTDDSLFGRNHSTSKGFGLETQNSTAEGFGINGVAVSQPGFGLGLEKAETENPGSVSPGNSRTQKTGTTKQEIAQPGTPDKEIIEKLTNKEAKTAMLTTEEINAQQVPKVYKKPPISLLEKPTGGSRTSNSVLAAKAQKLEETLKNFHVDARVIQVTQGPTVTRYEIQPAVGVKVSSIVRLSDDIALNLEAKSIRIEAPIPGKAAVGIEVENDSVTMVRLREIIDSEAFRKSKSKITFAVGKDISGNAIVADLKTMPHLLIAGSTGSGKSVCINSIITSFIYKANPDEVKLILIDPKVVELGNYNGIPHLMIPVVTDPSKAAAALNWAVAEMTDRYKKFAENGVRDLEAYNEFEKANGEEEKIMPQVVIIIDELADLMMAAPSQIEESICRLAQMARAAGMHLIVATQRPSVDVITGVIKANIPSRIAFAVSSQVDSRTILDMQGAEKLVGKGDMLFNPMGMGKPIRVQGTFISDGEVNKVIEFAKSQVDQNANSYNEDVLTRIERSNVQDSADDTDELLPDAIELVVRSGQASVSMLQRRFRIGYNRAARIVDMMEVRGIVGPQDGSRPRQVLMTEEEFENMGKEVEEKNE